MGGGSLLGIPEEQRPRIDLRRSRLGERPDHRSRASLSSTTEQHRTDGHPPLDGHGRFVDTGRTPSPREVTVWKRISQVVGSLVLLLIALLVVFMVSMRAKYPPVLTAVRRMNKATWNPRSMKTAGQPGASASVIRHVGRTSGTPYETPIGAVETDDGFAVALPYGTNPDWLKNVLAAGSAVLAHEGNTYQVDHPEVVPAAVANTYFPPNDQRAHRVFGIDDFLLLRRTESA